MKLTCRLWKLVTENNLCSVIENLCSNHVYKQNEKPTSNYQEQSCIQNSPSESKCIKRQPRREFKSQTCYRSPSSDSDNRLWCPVKPNSCRNRSPDPHPYKCTTSNTRYESESEVEEPYTPRHLHIGSVELHQHPGTTTYDPADRQSQSDTDPDDELSLSDTDSVPSSIPQSKDEHSLMDCISAPYCPHSFHLAMQKITVSNPPTPCPRCSKSCPTLLPRPSKVINTNRLKSDTKSTKPAKINCQKLASSCTCPQPTQKTPLLPTPPAPARQQIRKTLISGPPQCSNNQYHYKQYILGPYSVINNKQCPPLQVGPTYQIFWEHENLSSLGIIWLIKSYFHWFI